MSENIIYTDINNDMYIVINKDINKITENIKKLTDFEDINVILNSVSCFDDTITDKIINDSSLEITFHKMPYDKFVEFIRNHKCKCTKTCKHIVWGGFYNIPGVGGVSMTCYDRISKNGKLSAYQVMKKIQKNNLV